PQPEEQVDFRERFHHYLARESVPNASESVGNRLKVDGKHLPYEQCPHYRRVYAEYNSVTQTDGFTRLFFHLFLLCAPLNLSGDAIFALT
ncbi:MAG: hypothetical protein K2O67_01760, partial [Clostridia bacterium]|nr:hypothetical protein [Clostridia bacterium]